MKRFLARHGKSCPHYWSSGTRVVIDPVIKRFSSDTKMRRMGKGKYDQLSCAPCFTRMLSNCCVALSF